MTGRAEESEPNKKKGAYHMNSSSIYNSEFTGRARREAAERRAAAKEKDKQTILRAWANITEWHATLLAELAKQLANVTPADSVSIPAEELKGLIRAQSELEEIREGAADNGGAKHGADSAAGGAEHP